MVKPLPHKEYFEGVLQLRDMNEDILPWIEEQTIRDDKAIVTKASKVRGGSDLLFSSQKYLRQIGTKIKEKFSGQLTETRSLHTTARDGSNLYRVTVLFRQLPFKEGETVKYHNKEYLVLRIRDRAELQDVKTQKKQWVRLEYLGDRRRTSVSRF